MTAPNRPELVSVAEQFGPADVELVARALARRFCRDGRDPLVFLDAVAPGGAEPERADARAVLTALAGAGRLRPPDADTRTEWAVYWHGDGDGIRYDELHFSSREDAERRGPQMVGIHDITRWSLHRRTVSTWDGWTLVGPWVPVPTTPDAGDPS